MKRKRNRRHTRIWLVSFLLLACVAVFVFLWKGPESPTPAGSEPTETEVQQTLPPQTQPPETEPTLPQPIPETARATITVTGDIMSHMPVINAGLSGGSYNYDKFFTYITDYVSQADFAVANLETTLAGTENGDKYSGFPKFNCPDAMADALKNAGFDLLLTANNHTYDTGAYGMTRTQEVITDRGLLHLGTTASAEDPNYLVQDVNGIRIGMVCYTYGEIDDATGQKSVNGLPIRTSLTETINVFDYTKLDRFYEEMETLIGTMRDEGAEAIVLFIHWGNEYQMPQNSYQTSIAQEMCDLGVDVIAGGHPHVIQPAELLASNADPNHRTLCVYSVGNALSNQRASNMDLDTGHTEDGMLFSFTFVKYANGQVFLDSAEILPTWLYLRQRDSGKSYDILPLDTEISDWQETFHLGSAALQNAQDSYDRTLAIIGPGMEEAEAYFDETRTAREIEYHIFTGGVG